MRQSLKTPLLLILLTGTGFLPPVLARAASAKTTTVLQRTTAYALEDSRKIRGYFPAKAAVEIIAERTDGLVHVKFTAQSGKVVEALVRRSHLDLPPVPPASGPLNQKQETWTEVEDGTYDTGAMTDRGRAALALEGMSWRHAQTDHFVIHFEHGIFARKVARMAEFFYGYIPEDLGGVRDIRSARSHIFIFRKPGKWQFFINQAGEANMTWAFAFVEGMTMYLQEADDAQASSAVLAHEMTHLILNRYYERQPPRWLNEGIAEWYGEFGRAAFKGIMKSKSTVFKDLESMYDLPALMRMQKYPTTNEEVRRFYGTSKFLVGYLRLKYPDHDFAAFLQDMTAGMSSEEALRKHYGVKDLDQLQVQFAKFVRLEK